MKKIAISKIAEKNYYPKTIRLFLYCLYGWILLNTFSLLPYYNKFWGPNSFIPNQGISSSAIWHYFFQILDFPSYQNLYPLFLFGQIVSALICLIRIEWRWPRFLVLFFTYNLDSKAYLILDGGNNIIHLMLIYVLFMNPRDSGIAMSIPQYFSNALSNIAVYVARIQIVFVYLVAGLSKVTGEPWQNGTALFYTLNVDEYTLPFVSEWITKLYPLSILGSYMTVLFQISFPWLVWWPQTRRWMLYLGTFLHLQISIVMGLFMFGLAMITCYTIFNEEKRSIQLFQFLRKIDYVIPKFKLRKKIAVG